ncbi:MAG: alanine--tRNA ligase-related protein [Thermovirgaceae bacterium]
MKISTRILKVVESERKRALVALEKNIFHPSGGGQPGDTGTLKSNVFEADVTDCHYRDGIPLLVLNVKKGRPEQGMPVKAEVNLERNRILSRMHTGEHILSRILEDSHPGLQVYKVTIGEEESAIFLSYEGKIDWDVLFKAEEKALEIIRADLPVNVNIVERQKAQTIENLKINWERVKDPEIRVVSIPDFDAIACSGTHTDSTGDVGGILVTGFKGASPEWSVSFTVHRDRYLSEYSYVMRPLLRSIGCSSEKLPNVYESLQQERKQLLKALDKARNMIDLPWKFQDLGPCKLQYLFLEGLPMDMILPSVKETLDEKTIVLALVGKEPRKASFVLARGAACAFDLRHFIRDNPELKARGGGTPEWVQGETSEMSTEKWFEALKALSESNL